MCIRSCNGLTGALQCSQQGWRGVTVRVKATCRCWIPLINHRRLECCLLLLLLDWGRPSPYWVRLDTRYMYVHFNYSTCIHHNPPAVGVNSTYPAVLTHLTAHVSTSAGGGSIGHNSRPVSLAFCCQHEPAAAARAPARYTLTIPCT